MPEERIKFVMMILFSKSYKIKSNHIYNGG